MHSKVSINMPSEFAVDCGGMWLSPSSTISDNKVTPVLHLIQLFAAKSFVSAVCCFFFVCFFCTQLYIKLFSPLRCLVGQKKLLSALGISVQACAPPIPATPIAYKPSKMKYLFSAPLLLKLPRLLDLSNFHSSLLFLCVPCPQAHLQVEDAPLHLPGWWSLGGGLC